MLTIRPQRAVMPYLITAVLIGLVVMGGFHLVNALQRENGQLFTVTGKEAVKGDKASKYLVFTNVTTYEVEDSVLFWRWDSSDVYGRLTVGKTYRATLQGWRIPILSMYPNIHDPVEIATIPKPND